MSNFYPKMYQESIYTINYKKLKKKGIKCLLFDLDNTCIPYKDKTPTKELKKLFNSLTKQGFKVIIFSNSPKKRLDRFASLGVDYNYSSKKPLSKNFLKILNKYNYKKEEVCIIGDQLVTDIYGGNKVGIITCLVEPLSETDLIFTKLFRKIEAQIIKKFTKQGLLTKGEYYD